jgi:hypothetical protein
MRILKMMTALAVVALWLNVPARADESDKLTYLTFSKPVQLPGMTLPAGRYRFQIADQEESRRVIKVGSDDGKKQYGMLLTIPNEVRTPPKDALVLFGEAPADQPDAVKAWVYPGESIGYEFIYPHDEAVTIAKRHHTTVLSKSGDKIERIDETGNAAHGSTK